MFGFRVCARIGRNGYERVSENFYCFVGFLCWVWVRDFWILIRVRSCFVSRRVFGDRLELGSVVLMGWLSVQDLG